MLKSHLLHRYIAWQILVPFALGVGILLLLLSLERLLRLIDLVTASGAPVAHVFPLLLYLVPHYLILAIPAAFFLAVLLGFRRLQDNSELAVLQAAGQSVRGLLLPVLVLAGIATATMLLLTGLIDPYARYNYRTTVYNLSASGQLVNIQPGVFTKIGTDTVIRAEQVLNQGHFLAGVFLAAKKTDDSSQTFATAKTAELKQNEATGAVTLVMQQGNLFRQDGERHVGTLAFDTYPWDMPAPSDQPYGARGHDERELTIPELSHPPAAAISADTNPLKISAELAARLVQSLSLPLLAILAVPLALLGGGRTGQAYGLVIGIILLILYDKLLGFGQAAAAAGKAQPMLALWAPCLTLAVLSWAALTWAAPRRHRVRTPAAAL